MTIASLKKHLSHVILLVILLTVLVLIGLSFTRNRMLDKYRSNPDFTRVEPAFIQSQALIKKNPANDGAYYSLGQGFFSLKGYDDAIWAFKKAVEISPGTYYYWSFLGKSYQAKKDYISARDAYKKTLELKPDLPSAYTTLAWLYYFRLPNEVEKAFDVLRSGLEKFPQDKYILFDITRYFLYDKNEKEFRKYAPRYLVIDPTNAPIKDAYEKGIK